MYIIPKSYPYLAIKSLFEIDTLDVGINLVGDFLDTHPQRFDSLSEADQESLSEKVQSRSSENWFQLWISQMGKGLQTAGDTDTDTGIFKTVLRI